MSKDWVGRRKAERATLMLKAWVTFFDDELPAVEASVIDISKTGAKIEFLSPGPYPDEFNLSVPARNTQHIAKVRWQVGNQVGVEFIAARSEDSVDSLVTRVRAMERRFGALESGETGEIDSADLSPVVQRLEEIETRLNAVAMEQLAPVGEPAVSAQAHNAVLERLASLEQRLAELGTQPEPVLSPAEPSPEVIERLTRFECRLDELTNDLQSRIVAPAPAAPAVMATPVADTTAELARQILYFGERLAGLEAAFQERSFQQFDEPLEASKANEEHDHLAEVLSATMTRLAARVEQIGRDVQRLQADITAPTQQPATPVARLVAEPVVAHSAATPPDDDVRKDVASLKASVETLILAISMGLGRAAA